ncbi:UNKNOWN [Stylonychia lemnae]|uniref:Uncharacterized protein n=1 Tax=Stylonychia lemnae TaxID=5949 RepID=A0A078AIQ5_STYLE|nr:UNKNOWN [Stylonychia lemnae]|eukprot:CDW80693.1 UNKNOWN [Stylonychia lemnae]
MTSNEDSFKLTYLSPDLDSDYTEAINIMVNNSNAQESALNQYIKKSSKSSKPNSREQVKIKGQRSQKNNSFSNSKNEHEQSWVSFGEHIHQASHEDDFNGQQKDIVIEQADQLSKNSSNYKENVQYVVRNSQMLQQSSMQSSLDSQQKFNHYLHTFNNESPIRTPLLENQNQQMVSPRSVTKINSQSQKHIFNSDSKNQLQVLATDKVFIETEEDENQSIVSGQHDLVNLNSDKMTPFQDASKENFTNQPISCGSSSQEGESEPRPITSLPCPVNHNGFDPLLSQNYTTNPVPISFKNSQGIISVNSRRLSNASSKLKSSQINQNSRQSSEDKNLAIKTQHNKTQKQNNQVQPSHYYNKLQDTYCTQSSKRESSATKQEVTMFQKRKLSTGDNKSQNVSSGLSSVDRQSDLTPRTLNYQMHDIKQNKQVGDSNGNQLGQNKSVINYQMAVETEKQSNQIHRIKDTSNKQKLSQAFKEMNLQVLVELNKIKKPSKITLLSGKVLAMLLNIFQEEKYSENSLNDWVVIQKVLSSNSNKTMTDIALIKSKLNDIKDLEQPQRIKEILNENKVSINQITDKNCKIIFNLVALVIEQIVTRKDKREQKLQEILSRKDIEIETIQTNPDINNTNQNYATFESQQSNVITESTPIKENYYSSSPFNSNKYPKESQQPVSNKSSMLKQKQSPKQINIAKSVLASPLSTVSIQNKILKDVEKDNLKFIQFNKRVQQQYQSNQIISTNKNVIDILNKSPLRKPLKQDRSLSNSRDTSISKNALRNSVDSKLSEKRFDLKQSLIKPVIHSLNSTANLRARPTSTRQEVSATRGTEISLRQQQPKGQLEKQRSPQKTEFAKLAQVKSPVKQMSQKQKLAKAPNRPLVNKQASTIQQAQERNQAQLESERSTQDEQTAGTNQSHIESEKRNPIIIKSMPEEKELHMTPIKNNIYQLIIDKAHEIEKNMRNDNSGSKIDIGLIEQIKRRRIEQKLQQKEQEQEFATVD